MHLSYVTLMIQPNGQPAVAFRDTKHNLRLATPTAADASLWQVDTIVSPCATGMVALAATLSGEPLVVFCQRPSENNLVLRCAHRQPAGEWQLETITSGPGEVRGSPRALLIDPTGGAHLAYLYYAAEERGGLFYAHATPSGWQTERVPAPRHAWAAYAMTLDQQNQPHLVHYPFPLLTGDTASFQPTLNYSWRTPSGQWSSETVPTPALDRWGVQLSLQLDRQGCPHIAYTSGAGAQRALLYAVRTAPSATAGAAWDVRGLVADNVAATVALLRDRQHLLVAFCHLSSRLADAHAALASPDAALPTTEAVGPRMYVESDVTPSWAVDRRRVHVAYNEKHLVPEPVEWLAYAWTDNYGQQWQRTILYAEYYYSAYDPAVRHSAYQVRTND